MPKTIADLELGPLQADCGNVQSSRPPPQLYYWHRSPLRQADLSLCSVRQSGSRSDIAPYLQSARQTVSEALPTPAARKAEREIGEFRRYQQISRDFVQVNEKICRLRPVEDAVTAQKKRRKPSTGKSPAK